jgi:hypothetical protein
VRIGWKRRLQIAQVCDSLPVARLGVLRDLLAAALIWI